MTRTEGPVSYQFWKIVKDVDPPSGKRGEFAQCQCVCGMQSVVRKSDIKGGRSRGCRTCGNSVLIVWRGATLPLQVWLDRVGVARQLYAGRRANGWSIRDILGKGRTAEYLETLGPDDSDPEEYRRRPLPPHRANPLADTRSAMREWCGGDRTGSHLIGALLKAGVTSPGQLQAMTREEIEALPRVGPQCIERINQIREQS